MWGSGRGGGRCEIWLKEDLKQRKRPYFSGLLKFFNLFLQFLYLKGLCQDWRIVAVYL